MSKHFVFLYSVFTKVFIDLVGQLMVAELFALFSFPFIKFKKLFRTFPELGVTVKGLLVLLLAQILSDLYNNSNPEDFLRGWALIIVPIASVTFLVNYISKNEKGVVFFIFGLVIANLFFKEGELDASRMEENTNYFKERFTGFLIPAVIILIYYLYNRNRIKLGLFILLVFSLVCFFFDARSTGLVGLITFVLLFLKAKEIRFSKSKIFFLGIFFSAVFYLGYVYYVNQVLYNGFGGTNSKNQLAKTENPYNPFELLYYGRVDFVVLFHAVSDNPLMGFGSWGKDPYDRYARLTSNLSEEEVYKDRGFISAHSVLLGFWAYAGLLGFLATIFIFGRLFILLLKIYRMNVTSKNFPIILFYGVNMMWAFFFSPVAILRTSFPFFAAIIIIEYHRLSTFNKSIISSSYDE